MKQNRKYGLLLILILLFFMVSEAIASKTDMNFKLKYLNNKLSVNIEKVSLGSVLAKIQNKTGIKFYLDKESSDRTISVGFQSLPIEKAIQRVLITLNHAIIFGSDDNVQKVIIIGKSKTPLAGTLPASPARKEGDKKRSSFTSPISKGKTVSASNTMITEQAVQEGMKITNDGGGMKITNDGEGMEITNDGEGMKITNDGDEMKITHSPDMNPR